MSTPIQQTIVQFGREPRRDFNVSCQPLDWQPIDITFPQPFPTADVRIIVTSNDFRVNFEDDNNPVVGVVQDITPTGFRLWGRNPSDCVRSSAGFNWLALAETPGHERRPGIDVRLGVVQPQFFWGRCLDGPRFWNIGFNSRRAIGSADDPPVVLATASNLNTWATSTEISTNGGPIYAHDWESQTLAAVVALVQQPSSSGFRLKVANSDSHWGNCAFYHLALAHSRGSGTSVFIESGRVGAKQFEPCDNTGDWRQWHILFEDPFMTPPMVFVTANDLLDDGTSVPDRGPSLGRAVAAVGIAKNVTTHGFTLKARSSDCGGGFAGFFWVAIGCERFCA